MDELVSQDKNSEPIQRNKPTSGEVSTNTSFSNYGKDYLVIDHGEELQKHYETSQRDLQNQVHIMRSELSTIREVIIGLVFILAPLLAGWTAILVTRLLGYRSYEIYAVSVNIGMMAAVLLCDGPQFVEAFQRLFFHQEVPPVNQFYHTSAERTNPTLSSSGSENEQNSGYPGEGGEGVENGETVTDSVENLRAVDDEEDDDKENVEEHID